MLLYRQQIHTNVCQNPRLAEYPQKTGAYVLSESKQFERNQMCFIILDALSLKVTTPDLSAVGTLMLIQENERKKITHCS